ncbi:hypothetical protein [Neptunicoccus cionae]|uniref:D-galactarate dehydratase n=1 Tax=Neptunicoccus cionae TaxID=2035344 RepID=A0A916R0E4_9RHOB|nr:hypothetical protein [Amylibacter cionae]GGA24458.1 hypothetical protein GCM10011498_26820 [Amylibacter cionae]
MKTPLLLTTIATLALAGCGDQGFGLFKRGDKDAKPVAEAPVAPPEPAQSHPDTTALNKGGALTQDAAGAVSETALAEATKPVERPEQDKGTTIASLGLLERDGFWLRTPLVSSEADGRVVVEGSGASVNLRLLPSGGESGAGSQLSIAAMQVLGVPITDLVKVQVFIR